MLVCLKEFSSYTHKKQASISSNFSSVHWASLFYGIREALIQQNQQDQEFAKLSMAPPTKKDGKTKGQKSILQMAGFAREVEAPTAEPSRANNPNTVDVMAGHTQELNAEHERLLQARKEFKERWLDEHDWLRFNYDTGRAYCIYCKEDSRCRSAFGKEGATNLRTSAFKEHAASGQHRHASWLATQGKDSLQKVEKRKNDSVDKEVLTLMKCAYFIGKEDLAYRKFGSLLHLRDCGSIALLMYNDDKACSYFLKCIIQSLEEEVFEKIRRSPWYGIMVDESTDISVVQHLILYATYLDDFQPKKSFISLLPLQQGDEKTISAAIVDKLAEGKLDLTKMIGFGSDGAAVMIGCRIGVATRLKDYHPFMTSIHCSS